MTNFISFVAPYSHSSGHAQSWISGRNYWKLRRCWHPIHSSSCSGVSGEDTGWVFFRFSCLCWINDEQGAKLHFLSSLCVKYWFLASYYKLTKIKAHETRSQKTNFHLVDNSFSEISTEITDFAGVGVTNHYKSPFKHTMWVWFVQVEISVSFLTLDLWLVSCNQFMTPPVLDCGPLRCVGCLHRKHHLLSFHSHLYCPNRT